jgi:hypothetical protein
MEDTRLHFHILFIRIYRLILNSLSLFLTQYFRNRLFGSLFRRRKKINLLSPISYTYTLYPYSYKDEVGGAGASWRSHAKLN